MSQDKTRYYLSYTGVASGKACNSFVNEGSDADVTYSAKDAAEQVEDLLTQAMPLRSWAAKDANQAHAMLVASLDVLTITLVRVDK